VYSAGGDGVCGCVCEGKEVTHEVEDRGALSASVHGVAGVRHDLVTEQQLFEKSTLNSCP